MVTKLQKQIENSETVNENLNAAMLLVKRYGIIIQIILIQFKNIFNFEKTSINMDDNKAVVNVVPTSSANITSKMGVNKVKSETNPKKIVKQDEKARKFAEAVYKYRNSNFDFTPNFNFRYHHESVDNVIDYVFDTINNESISINEIEELSNNAMSYLNECVSSGMTTLTEASDSELENPKEIVQEINTAAKSKNSTKIKNALKKAAKWVFEYGYAQEHEYDTRWLFRILTAAISGFITGFTSVKAAKALLAIQLSGGSFGVPGFVINVLIFIITTISNIVFSKISERMTYAALEDNIKLTKENIEKIKSISDTIEDPKEKKKYDKILNKLNKVLNDLISIQHSHEYIEYMNKKKLKQIPKETVTETIQLLYNAAILCEDSDQSEKYLTISDKLQSLCE